MIEIFCQSNCYGWWVNERAEFDVMDKVTRGATERLLSDLSAHLQWAHYGTVGRGDGGEWGGALDGHAGSDSCCICELIRAARSIHRGCRALAGMRWR